MLQVQTARERGADVLFISEQHKWSENSAWYQDASRSLREASGRSLIAGDFNSKSPEWGEARLDRRGILVGEMVARNDLIVLTWGRDFTFRRGAEGSIINLTIAAPRLASRIGDWCVLEVITLSDHQCSGGHRH